MTVFSDNPATRQNRTDAPGLTPGTTETSGGPSSRFGRAALMTARRPRRVGGQTSEWFRAAYELAPIGTAVIELGPEGQRWFLLVNPALATMLGRPEHELVGRDLNDLSDPAYAEEELDVVREFMAGSRHSYIQHKRYVGADGRPIWVEVRASRIHLPRHPGVTKLAHFIDGTARHETEEYRARAAATKVIVARLVTRVLAGEPAPEIYTMVVDQVAHLFDAESVSLLLVDPATGLTDVVAGTGPANERLTSGEIPVHQEMIRQLIAQGTRALPLPDSGFGNLGEWRAVLGPVATARFGPETSGGLIVIGRPPGAALFDPADTELLMTLGQQVALAIELQQARLDKERLALLEERHRIARDLHDTVVQDLIAIRMQLDAGVKASPDPVRRERDGVIADQVEAALRRLRGSVFDLREEPGVQFLETSVRAMADEAARVLGHRPVVHLAGRLETVPTTVVSSLLAVLREALSNVARHARASATVVHLTVDDDHLRLVVEDDGRGLPEHRTVGDGLTNIHDRAVALGGRATVTARTPHGTRLAWTCPLPGGCPAGARRPPRTTRSGRAIPPAAWPPSTTRPERVPWRRTKRDDRD